MATRDRAVYAPGFKRPPRDGRGRRQGARATKVRRRRLSFVVAHRATPIGGRGASANRRTIRLNCERTMALPALSPCRHARHEPAASPGSGASADVANLAPNILGVRHWARLLRGLLYATSPRLRWSQLLQRTFDVDVLECPKCCGRIRIVEAVVEPNSARRILEHLAIAVDAPRLVRARGPTTLEADEPDAA